MSKEKANVINEYHLHKEKPQQLQFAIHDLGSYLRKNQADTTKPHIHSYYQIIWFQSGKGTHFVDFKAYDVLENAIFFIAPNQVHYFDQHTDYEGVLIHFNESFLVQKDTEIDFFLKCSLFNNPYQTPSCCIGKGIEPILGEYIQQINAELAEDTAFGKEELLRTYLKSFLIQVQRRKNEYDKIQGKAPFLVDEKRLQLIHFVNLISENYKKGLTVAEYAAIMHVSPRTLTDLTHQQLNKTPLQMIQERIILEAKRFLLHSSLNVNQVGYRLGFDDPSYFVKYFKKHAGISPSGFRKTVQ
ncbi:AraC family transcriptional regulator [Chitinophaga arvensicola]|uniref:AraC-type DNA-binding protein n=1 Tax=Chitinophaga arvensicola TaxID=29529 RepID=A0A1I0RV66_9BACT|nr:helix-turn-helix transcriptional regulator [Chitinophaga arvensicola]SEW45198.1 AraC-type DNA-binding protein [Chitinophaga arvensicola]